MAPQPKKRSGLAMIGGIAGAVLVALVVIAVKVGLGSALSSDSAPKNPFEQTAAESYAHGADGIVLPTASAVPGFTTEQVSAALKNVKKAMIAGRLSETMLYQHDRTALVALFSGYGADGVEEMFKQKLGGIIATMIPPSHHLTADPIRVKGEMTFEGATVEGVRVLKVKTNFVWVYPFTGELKTAGDHLVSVHDKVTWVFPAQDEVDPDYVGMYIDEESEFVASNVDCDLFDQDLITLGKPVTVNGAEAGDPDDALDPNGSMDIPESLAC
jgi:hypothetical protein